MESVGVNCQSVKGESIEGKGTTSLLWALTGIISLIVALTTIAACWILNPWFDFWRDAFSDFGVTRAAVRGCTTGVRYILPYSS